MRMKNGGGNLKKVEGVDGNIRRNKKLSEYMRRKHDTNDSKILYEI